MDDFFPLPFTPQDKLDIPQANCKQLEAINAPIDANIRVFAGPGAGKTFTLKYRYLRMVEAGIAPSMVVVVTFSSKMASEMLEKIKAVCPDAQDEQICTIHALCKRILTNWDDTSPYYGWTVPKEWEVKKTINEAIEKLWYGDELPGWKEVLYWIDNSKYQGFVNGESLAFFQDNLGNSYGLALYKIRKEFDNWLKYRKMLTFADMLFLVEYHLKSSASFKAKWQAKFPYILIDEFQDTNAQAIRILLTIARYSFVVGDVDQMLYRFQGAKPEISTSDYAPGITTILLDKNYRSVSSVITASQKLITHNYSIAGGPYPQEFMKDVSGIRDAGLPISYQFVETIDDEAELAASTILEQCQNGYGFGDFFIGARTRAQLGYFEGVLLKAGIKFINLCGGSFWQSKHVTDVIGYLRLAHNPADKIAFKQVYNIASANNKNRDGKYLNHRWLGAEFLKITDESYLNIWRAPDRNKRYYYGVKDLEEFVEELQAEIKRGSVESSIQFILDNCYISWLKADEGIVSGDEAENGKLEDFKTVLEIAASYSSVKEFLTYVDEAIKQADDAKNGDWTQYTILSTYHRLKGLECRVMIGTGWCEGYQVIKRGDDEWQEPRGLLPHTFSLVEPPQFGVLPTGGKAPIADERCIAFVAVSRAKDRVFLSGCAKYRKWVLFPSRFVAEAMRQEAE